MTESHDIYVQILPIIKSQSSNKIVLCKWIQGDYKDRYTGLIRPVASQASPNDSNFREKLEAVATSLLPQHLTPHKQGIELTAILRFTDPPAYTEYVYIVYLNEDAVAITDVLFDDNPCEWFRWEDIPFEQMPEDDGLWYPKVLQEGLKVTGSFTFGSWSEKTLKAHHIDAVTQL
ncbi:uncharacterized protein LOC119081315 [Bradysia coprophila]|uniref:uncharacterized protein LOC119081315 n=1 Tax=Bradysia coprophila TaxID=38358 RepID=UPI00187DC8FA|nr:uncharacterized protein LOC119081315 [Bradysia coprophila]